MYTWTLYTAILWTNVTPINLIQTKHVSLWCPSKSSLLKIFPNLRTEPPSYLEAAPPSASHSERQGSRYPAKKLPFFQKLARMVPQEPQPGLWGAHYIFNTSFPFSEAGDIRTCVGYPKRLRGWNGAIEVKWPTLDATVSSTVVCSFLFTLSKNIGERSAPDNGFYRDFQVFVKMEMICS